MSKKLEEKVLEEVLSVLFLPIFTGRVLDYNSLRYNQFLCDSFQWKIYGIWKHYHYFGTGIHHIFSFSSNSRENS